MRYATPIEGSPLADLVDDPLGAEFIIAKDNVTKMTPQVVSTDALSASDFGYASFTLDIVETISFQIATFIYNTSTHNLELTSSSLTISADSITLVNENLPVATNVVVVKGGYSSYKIRVSKQGYLSYEKVFTVSELAVYESNAVLKVTLFADPDKAMYFDGVNDYIDLGNIYDNVQFPITISAWINLDPTQQYIGAIFDSQDNDAIYNGFQFAVTTTNLFLQYGDGRGQNHPAYRGGKSSTGNDMSGKWIHVTAVARGESNISLFINGVDVGGTEQGDSPLPMSSNFPNAFASIGRSTANGLQLFFKGYMDDVTIWKKAVRRNDVPALMTKTFSGSESDLIGHWNFNETSGDPVLDKSTFGNDGLIKGGAHRVYSTAPNN